MIADLWTATAGAHVELAISRVEVTPSHVRERGTILSWSGMGGRIRADNGDDTIALYYWSIMQASGGWLPASGLSSVACRGTSDRQPRS